MKCLNCDNEAKWKSTKFVSPLCSKCARVEVNKLLETGNFDISETSIKDFYELIDDPDFINGSTQTIDGDLVILGKISAMR